MIHLYFTLKRQPLLSASRKTSVLNRYPNHGFTIVELLIVIVVIGILAAITIIAFSGIQTRARIAVLQGDLSGAVTTLGAAYVNNGTYPTDLASAVLEASPGTVYQYTGGTNSYCVTGTSNGVAFMVSSSNANPTAGVCPGHTAPGVVNNSGIVTTFAGSSLGYVDANGTNAKFNYPDGVAIDNSGNLLIADRGNSIIRKITPAGDVSAFAGSGVQGSLNGTGTSAQFYYPEGIVFDPSGNLYVTDRGNNLIRKITSSGTVSTFAGSGVAGSANGTGTAAQFNAPYGIAIDASANLYVADSGNNQIRKITSSGIVTTLAGSTTAGATDGTGLAAQFNGPYGVAIDTSSNIFVTDYNNNTIRKISPSGVVTTFAGDGTTGYLDGAGTASEFRHPFGIAIDSTNNLYITDRSNYRIREVTSDAVVTTLAGSSLGSVDGTGTAAQFYYPQGIVVNSSGVIYVVDQGDFRIRMIK